MKGVIHDRVFKTYTYMNLVTQPIREEVVKYNWLISNYECNCYPDKRISFENEYAWISGEDLLSIVNQYDIQFVWGVFSAFPKEIELDDVLKYDLPCAAGCAEFWHNPISIQHPMAIMELVPWDSTLFLLISKEDEIVNKFISAFPECKDLEIYNKEVIQG